MLCVPSSRSASSVASARAEVAALDELVVLGLELPERVFEGRDLGAGLRQVGGRYLAVGELDAHDAFEAHDLGTRRVELHPRLLVRGDLTCESGFEAFQLAAGVVELRERVFEVAAALFDLAGQRNLEATGLDPCRSSSVRDSSRSRVRSASTASRRAASARVRSSWTTRASRSAACTSSACSMRATRSRAAPSSTSVAVCSVS